MSEGTFVPAMTADDIADFFERFFPGAKRFGARVERVGEGEVEVRLTFSERLLRPGGTVSGPALMTLADTAMYFLVLTQVGPTMAHAVTSNLNMHFLRRPKPVDIIAHVRMLRLGRRHAVGEVTLRSEGDDAPVAHAVVTYALPHSKASS
jgi:uncharacterized protein (TIGR00369 family)